MQQNKSNVETPLNYKYCIITVSKLVHGCITKGQKANNKESEKQASKTKPKKCTL